jgi:carbonic anhydrase
MNCSNSFAGSIFLERKIEGASMKHFLLIATCVLANCAQSTVRAEPKNSPTSRVAAYRERQEKATPSGVLSWLKIGNARFSRGASEHGGFPADARNRIKDSSSSQRPLAAILSCIDSRTSPEIVFDTSVGDLFTVRVGANVVNDDILGSLEIAAESGVRVIVVLGHTDCGGIKGACSGLKLGHMTQLLDRIKPAIAQANAHLDADVVLSHSVGERTVTNRRYVAEVSHMNALQSVHQIWQRSRLLRDKVKRGEIILVPALYDVDTGIVTFDQPIERD